MDIGRVADRYHRLFMNRLEREGRYEAFRECRWQLYNSPEWRGSYKQTWWPAAREFGFISKRDELERFEDFILHGQRTKMQEQLEEMKKEIRKEREEKDLNEVLVTLGQASELDLPPDIAWVYNHPAMFRKVDEDTGMVELTLKDMEGAPGKGAVGMLTFFVNKKADFYKLVLSHLSKKSVQGKEEDSSLEDDLRGIKEIDDMLGSI